MRILIIGLGLSGKSALQKLYRQGHRHFLLVDKNLPDLNDVCFRLEGAIIEFAADDQHLSQCRLEGCRLCLLSPGVGPASRAYQLAHELGIPVKGEMELGLEGLLGKKVIVTGSNGKSTTVTLAAHLLRAGGLDAEAVGNIGVPLSSIEKSSPSKIWIVEASSFNLETLTSPVFDLGVVLNISENHLDRYGHIQTYAKSKSMIQNGLKEDAELWIDSTARRFKELWHHRSLQLWKDSDFLKNVTHSKVLQEVLDKQIAAKFIKDYKCELSHDVENIFIALAIAEKMGCPLELALEGLCSYTKLPHRMESAGVLEDITFINDSKSTNVASTLFALNSVQGPIVLIAGGVHKGASYQPWCEELKRKAAQVCVIGQAQDILENDLRACVPVKRCRNLQEAVKEAYVLLKKQPEGLPKTVLFSPGCSSYDMFSNFEQRGASFKNCINELIKSGGRDD